MIKNYVCATLVRRNFIVVSIVSRLSPGPAWSRHVAAVCPQGVSGRVQSAVYDIYTSTLSSLSRMAFTLHFLTSEHSTPSLR
jgi:hypothetical protein